MGHSIAEKRDPNSAKSDRYINPSCLTPGATYRYSGMCGEIFMVIIEK
jgi:hypothetical protein